MNKADSPEQWVKRSTLAWLLVAQVLCILPLLVYLPLWVPVLWLITLTWRIQAFRGAWPLPSSKVKFLVGALSIIALVASYRGFGLEPLVAFLVVSFVLKILEVRKKQDVLLVLHVAFITVAAQFLFFQTVLIAIYALICVIVLLSAWSNVYRRREVKITKQLYASTSILLQSIPVMLVLFIVLPRLGTLWHVPIPNSTGKTGFSDTLSPGDLSLLSQSREVAFRVTFEGEGQAQIPPRKDWYWRGLVMDAFDGRAWRNVDKYYGLANAEGGPPNHWKLTIPDEAHYYRYSILMEPHQQQWLFSMMAPVYAESSSERLFFTPDYLTKSIRNISSRSQYWVVSTNTYRVAAEELSSTVEKHNLRLPENVNPRAQALAQSWVLTGLTEDEIVRKALDMYRESFTYTLKPPPLGADSVDEFLFFTQKGFCEHYSSSFVFLMRAAGIPARVVVGYQGGEYNPSENYIIVRQSQAHAWSEVWMQGRGWIRVDPTAAVSPSRIEEGIEASLNLDEQALVNGRFAGSFVEYMQLQLDAFTYKWHRWVLGYDAAKQASIFQQLLGGGDVWRIALLFVGSISVLLFSYFAYLMWTGRAQDLSQEAKLYQKLQKRLRKRGFSPETGETPEAFISRVINVQPAWATSLKEIQQSFYLLAYAEKAECAQLLEQQIRGLKLPK